MFTLRYVSLVLVVLGAIGCDPGGVNMGGEDELDPILCITHFDVVGDIQHSEGVGDSCAGAGTWTFTASTPTADEDYQQCSDAPSGESFTITVNGQAATGYAAISGTDPWDVSISDKGGSCAGSFTIEKDGGILWGLRGSEDGPDGPLSGSARFEKHRQ